MSGYPHIRRTHSSLRQLQKLRELEDEFNIQDTATLVSAYNEARDSHEHHDELLNWIKKYIPFFEKETTSECCHEAMEFVQLANIIPEVPSEMRLLVDVFNVLCRKIHWGEYGEEELIEAFTYFLLAVDCKVFARNPYPLTKIARDVMKKLGSDQTFSRGTYPTHSISILALHHLCAIIHEVDPSEFDHDRQEGLYQEMKQCLQNIIDSQTYYPFYYQATLTQQSLARMDSNASVSSKEIWYRLFCGVKGTAYFCQALLGAIAMNFDLDSLENGIEEWLEACTSHRIKQNSWYENVQPLISSRILVQNNSEKLDTFNECLFKVEEIQHENGDEETQKALRFAMIHQVILLALECPIESVMEWTIVHLSYFGKCCAPEKGWAQDPVILEALVAAILDVQHKVQFRSHMEGVLATLGFHVGKEKLDKLIEQLEHRVQLTEDNKDTGTAQDRSGCESLFNKIKKDMLLVDSLSTRLVTQNMLKTQYQQYSKNEPSRHVNELDHSLLLYEKVFTSNGQVQIMKRPIPLEDLFKNRQLSRTTSSESVKRVLLFGNPGTGKTTVAKKIAYKWSLGQWGDAFDMLYLIPFRELSSNNYDDSSMRKQRNVETAITNICFPGKCDERFEALRLQVEEELDKESTLIVFDGLDEGEEMTREMIESTELKPCRVMVLSRPQNLHRERHIANVEVECVGLNDEQLIHFIKSECSSSELMEHLQRHRDVWEISHAPVVANILTFLYKTRKEDLISEESSFNMHSLYWKMSVQVWKRYIEKNNSNATRDLIFDALEEVAFHALKDGHIFIGQEMVHEVSQDLQTSDVLEDSGFLLLKRECAYYQFPHLTFQEFFAGQYMAHSMMGEYMRRKQGVVKFLRENKYCANFKHAFCFMIQELTLENADEGYLEVESIINDGPTALGYQHHLLLNMELLQASLSASRPYDRERILDSTEVLGRAIEWSERRECYSDALLGTMFGSEQVSSLKMYADSSANVTEKFTELFVHVAKVARFVPEQWKKVMEILAKDLNDEDGAKAVLCIVPLMTAIPEKMNNLLEVYWALVKGPKEITKTAALAQLSDIARLMREAADQVFERFKCHAFDGDTTTKEATCLVDYPALAQLMPDQWQEMLEMIKRACLDSEIVKYMELNQLGRLVEFVPESRGQVMELVRELTSTDNNSKSGVARSCLSLIKALPENSTEIVEILWTLCEDGDRDVYTAARNQMVQIMLSWGEIEDTSIDALLKFGEGEPVNSRSSLVQLIAIAHRLAEKAPEGVDCLLSSLSREDLMILWDELAFLIRDLIGTKTAKEMGSHWLHFMILKVVQPPEVEEQELRMLIDNIDSDPINIRIKSAKFMGSAQCPCRLLAPMALGKLALNCPEYEEDVVNSIDEFSQDEDEDVAKEACIQMFSSLERLSHRAERIMNRLQESLHRFECFEFLRMRTSVSLDALLKAYMKCHNDFLVFWIVWKSFDTPVTMETRSGKFQLTVQTSSNNKRTHKFQTVEEAEAFASSFDECIEVVFPDVASLIPRLDSKERQRSNNPFFANVRERLTSSSFWDH